MYKKYRKCQKFFRFFGFFTKFKKKIIKYYLKSSRFAVVEIEIIGFSFLMRRRKPCENPSSKEYRIYGWMNGLVPVQVPVQSGAATASHGSFLGNRSRRNFRTVTVFGKRLIHSLSIPVASRHSPISFPAHDHPASHTHVSMTPSYASAPVPSCFEPRSSPRNLSI